LTRGWNVSYLALDEFAHFVGDAEADGPAVASRIFAAATPSVATFAPYGRVVVTSTPWGSNLFSELHTRAENGEISGAVAFHETTARMNPQVTPEFLEAQRAALGDDDFAREYEAAFLSGAGSFFDMGRVRECVGDWKEALPSDCEAWILALDPALEGAFAAAVVGRPRKRPWADERLIVGHGARWVPPKRKRRQYRSAAERESIMGTVFDAVAAIAARYRPTRVVSDQHLPGVVVEELRKRGVHVAIRPWTGPSRTEAFAAVRARVNTGRIEFPDDPQLLTELSRIRTKYRSGGSAVEIPKTGDSHQDLAVAVAAGVAEMERTGSGRGEGASVGTLGQSLAARMGTDATYLARGRVTNIPTHGKL
jgi:hypothetical protein